MAGLPSSTFNTMAEYQVAPKSQTHNVFVTYSGKRRRRAPVVTDLVIVPLAPAVIAVAGCITYDVGQPVLFQLAAITAIAISSAVPATVTIALVVAPAPANCRQSGGQRLPCRLRGRLRIGQ